MSTKLPDNAAARRLYDDAVELQLLASRFEDLLEEHAPDELARLQASIQASNATLADPARGSLWTAKRKVA